MNTYLIGTGGWAYFRIPGLRPLQAYSRAFNFVEVNSTYYRKIPLHQVQLWKKTVPPDFQFSVRMRRTFVEKYKIEPRNKVLKIFEYMKDVCKILRTDLLHLLIPSGTQLSDALANNFKKLVSKTDLDDLRLILEIRNPQKNRPSSEILDAMKANSMIHSVDLSRGEHPAYQSDILYTRLFGKGKDNVYEPTDLELKEIDHKANRSGSSRVAMSFHFVKMYKDAARLKIYKDTGAFPKVTSSVGSASLEEVLKEDVKFPTSKRQLIEKQGWKLFDVSTSERVRAMDWLQQLPQSVYRNLSELKQDLNRMPLKEAV